MKTPPRQLWRLRLTAPHRAFTESQALAAGLLLHAQYSVLDSVLVQIGALQQSYVVLTGCESCEWERCEPGCGVEMLRRLFERHAPELSLQPAPGALAPRPYIRAVLALPTRKAQLHSDLLLPWPEARLVVSWRRGRRGATQAAVLLLVGEQGPCPSTSLHQQGWQPWAIPAALGLRQLALPVPPALPFARPYQYAPTLLLADQSPPNTTVPVSPERSELLDEQLAGWLEILLTNPHLPSEVLPKTTSDAQPCPWPTGPGPLTPAALGILVAQLVAEPSFQSERKGQSGLSKGRLVKNAGLSENVARTLMVWFDRAGVLAPPEDGQGLWRAPRPFALTDLEQIAAKLRATPLPTGEEIRAAYGGEA